MVVLNIIFPLFSTFTLSNILKYSNNFPKINIVMLNDDIIEFNYKKL
jgi:hypothetical protein